jgi:hypothetical protein
MEEAVTAALTAAESFLLLLDDLGSDDAKPSGATAKVLLAHAATHLREALAEVTEMRSQRADADLDAVLATVRDEVRAQAGAHLAGPPEWLCVVCECRYSGRKPADGICLTCADGNVQHLVGTTVALDADDAPDPLTGVVVAVYPNGTADVEWGPDDGTQVTCPIREKLTNLRPFRPRHLSAVAQEGGASS